MIWLIVTHPFVSFIMCDSREVKLKITEIIRFVLSFPPYLLGQFVQGTIQSTIVCYWLPFCIPSFLTFQPPLLVALLLWSKNYLLIFFESLFKDAKYVLGSGCQALSHQSFDFVCFEHFRGWQPTSSLYPDVPKRDYSLGCQISRDRTLSHTPSRRNTQTQAFTECVFGTVESCVNVVKNESVSLVGTSQQVTRGHCSSLTYL